jgi:hypothetical protein
MKDLQTVERQIKELAAELIDLRKKLAAAEKRMQGLIEERADIQARERYQRKETRQ